MIGDIRLPSARAEDHYFRRVLRALNRRRLGAVALVTLLLSAGPLSGAELGFFSPAEIALLWLEHFVELAILAATLTIVYTLLDEAMWHHLPPPLRLLADSLRFGLPAVFLVLIADVHRRALQVDSAAHAAEMSRVQLGHDESEQQLALLQAQIEPHFLFNVLGNVRRLYRTQPQAGSETIVSLMRYLRAALPQLRSQSTSLGSELELVRAYLDLLQVRMAARLTFSIEVDPTLHHVEFPPMLLITLVENAIKHGLDPVGGGSVCVRARRHRDILHVTVLDDGAGLGAAGSSGTGVGLVNVRRQLAFRYKGRARFTLEARTPSGTSATIWMPLSAPVTAPNRDRRERAAA